MTRAEPVSGLHPDGALFDLLMGVMNSLEIWSGAADDEARGLAWRDAVTARMTESSLYVPYERLVSEAAVACGLPPDAPIQLFAGWAAMEPWPDAAALDRLTVPYAFVTNCSSELAAVAAGRSGLAPAFTLSAEEAGRYKPEPEVYLVACRRLGTSPKRTLFLAGSPYDADGADAAGLEAWFVARRTDQQPTAPAIRSAGSLEEVVDAVGRDGPTA